MSSKTLNIKKIVNDQRFTADMNGLMDIPEHEGIYGIYCDAVLMDMRMPEMGELEAIRGIRAMRRFVARKIPVS